MSIPFHMSPAYTPPITGVAVLRHGASEHAWLKLDECKHLVEKSNDIHSRIAAGLLDTLTLAQGRTCRTDRVQICMDLNPCISLNLILKTSIKYYYASWYSEGQGHWQCLLIKLNLQYYYSIPSGWKLLRCEFIWYSYCLPYYSYYILFKLSGWRLPWCGFAWFSYNLNSQFITIKTGDYLDVDSSDIHTILPHYFIIILLPSYIAREVTTV